MDQSLTSRPDNLFKPNKRRKLQRRRNVTDDDDDDQASFNNEASEDAAARVEDQSEMQKPLVRRPDVKKRGINFSSVATPPAAADISLALVSEQEQRDKDLAQTGRFVKPSTGVRVVEDKHLTAYVDSKLAEMRSSTSNSQAQHINATAEMLDAGLDDQPDFGEGVISGDAMQQDETTKNGLLRAQGHSARSRNRRPRRQPPRRDESAVARESMVDQIFAESQVPLYDQSKPPPAAAESTGQDADEAAAQAFRAEFLAGLAERRRRRAPAAPTGAKAAQASTGPKLGGSRSQREKMKALEEAKNAAGKK